MDLWIYGYMQAKNLACVQIHIYMYMCIYVYPCIRVYVYILKHCGCLAKRLMHEKCASINLRMYRHTCIHIYIFLCTYLHPSIGAYGEEMEVSI
jgi:hypothetical protein